MSWQTINRPSSAVMAVMVNADKRQVALRFKDSSCYRYSNVSSTDILELTGGNISIGSWVNRSLKKKSVRVRCLERPVRAEKLPRKAKKAIFYKTRVRGYWKQWDE